MSSGEGLSSPEGNVWLVGLDVSENARRALRWAAGVARGRDVRLHVVSAWQYPSLGLLPTVGSAIPAFDESGGEAIGRNIAEIAREVATETEVDIETTLALGPATQVLLEALEDADLVVVGNRGRGGFARLTLGSVSHQLATHARRPAIIVPDHTEHTSLHRVVIGVDGSHNSMAALRWAHDFVSDAGELVAVGVWESPDGGDDVPDRAKWNSMREAAEHDFAAAVDDVEALVGAPARFSRVFESGRARQRLVEHAGDADLLVVGERGHRGFLGGVLGSVTTWVIHHLACPTAVIPAPDTNAESPPSSVGS